MFDLYQIVVPERQHRPERHGIGSCPECLCNVRELAGAAFQDQWSVGFWRLCQATSAALPSAIKVSMLDPSEQWSIAVSRAIHTSNNCLSAQRSSSLLDKRLFVDRNE